tara:strand:+ start:541 stop:1017 length:477 start_codon:yes stop_codon:yes gene_type:complete
MIQLIDIYNKYKNNAYIEHKGEWMPLTEGYCKSHDLKVKEDMLFGKIGEDFTQQLFEGNTKIEIKTERDIWETTGNICIEMRYKNQPSGISTTKASVWIHLLSVNNVIKGGFIFKVEELKALIKKRHREGKLKVVMGGDDNMSQLALMPIKELWSLKF